MEYWETLLSHELGPRHEFEGLAKGGPERREDEHPLYLLSSLKRIRVFVGFVLTGRAGHEPHRQHRSTHDG